MEKREKMGEKEEIHLYPSPHRLVSKGCGLGPARRSFLSITYSFRSSSSLF